MDWVFGKKKLKDFLDINPALKDRYIKDDKINFIDRKNEIYEIADIGPNYVKAFETDMYVDSALDWTTLLKILNPKHIDEFFEITNKGIDNLTGSAAANLPKNADTNNISIDTRKVLITNTLKKFSINDEFTPKEITIKLLEVVNEKFKQEMDKCILKTSEKTSEKISENSKDKCLEPLDIQIQSIKEAKIIEAKEKEKTKKKPVLQSSTREKTIVSLPDAKKSIIQNTKSVTDATRSSTWRKGGKRGKYTKKLKRKKRKTPKHNL